MGYLIASGALLLAIIFVVGGLHLLAYLMEKVGEDALVILTCIGAGILGIIVFGGQIEKNLDKCGSLKCDSQVAEEGDME